MYFNKAVMGNDPTDYLIDHSIMFYLMDEDGEFTDYFGLTLLLLSQDHSIRISAMWMKRALSDSTSCHPPQARH